MSKTRVYFDGQLKAGEQVSLNHQDSQHLLRVLRMKKGEACVLFNGSGGEYEAEIIDVERCDAQLLVKKFININREASISVHLGQALSRGERMDYAIQKAVEVGAAEITPLFTARCNVRLSHDRIPKRVEHWQKVAISACEQSGRTKVVKIHSPIGLDEWLTQARGEKLVCDVSDSKRKKLDAQTEVSLLIGPEGGLTADEIKLAHHHGFHSYSLGPRTLRTETAAPVAISLITNQ